MSEPAPLIHAEETVATVLPESFAFVMNVRHLTDAVSYSLAPGHELRRATAAEVEVIKDTVKRLTPFSPLLECLWECRWPHPGGRIELLPEAEWRYLVVAFRGSNARSVELAKAFDLAPTELEVGFTILRDLGGAGVTFHLGCLFHVLEHAFHTPSFFVDVSAADIDELRIIDSQLEQHDHRLVDVQRIATQLSQVKQLEQSSPLRFLGYFAVLESLLTHAPKPSDPYDSITRQVKKKLALLDHRWPQKIDYVLFGGASPDTVWSKTYTYRSLLAHGGAQELTGKLAALRSHEAALTLMRTTVKAVIRQALSEPQLLSDLREC